MDNYDALTTFKPTVKELAKRNIRENASKGKS